MAQATIRLIVFDLDGTLVDSRTTIVSTMQQAFTAKGRTAPSEKQICNIIGLKLEAAVAALLPSQAREQEVHELSGCYREIFARNRNDDGFRERLFPGVRNLLRTFDRPEMFLGIATSKGRRALHETLVYHEIAAHFSTLRCADDGPSKPHPAILLRALDDVGVTPEEAVFVGDTTYDMETARNAGTRALGVSWGHHSGTALMEAGAARVLRSTEELQVLLMDMIGVGEVCRVAP
jgi:phosphoglycolate phosphatase